MTHSYIEISRADHDAYKDTMAAAKLAYDAGDWAEGDRLVEELDLIAGRFLVFSPAVPEPVRLTRRSRVASYLRGVADRLGDCL